MNLAEVHGDVQIAIVEAEIAVMVGDRHFLQKRTFHIGLNEGCGERPKDCFLVGADTLQVMLVCPFAKNAKPLTKRFDDLDPFDF